MQHVLDAEEGRENQQGSMEKGSYTMTGEYHGAITRSVPLFSSVTAPVLRSVDSIAVAKLLKDRKQYEIEVDEKKL